MTPHRYPLATSLLCQPGEHPCGNSMASSPRVHKDIDQKDLAIAPLSNEAPREDIVLEQQVGTRPSVIDGVVTRLGFKLDREELLEVLLGQLRDLEAFGMARHEERSDVRGVRGLFRSEAENSVHRPILRSQSSLNDREPRTYSTRSMQVGVVGRTLRRYDQVLMERFSRRSLVQGMVASGVLVAVPETERTVAGAEEASPLTRSSFVPYLNTTFRLTDGWRSVPADLTRIDDLAATTRTTEEHRFSLIFQSSDSKRLPQARRLLVHPRRTTVELFIVPVGRRTSVQMYQAIIHRTSS